MTGDWGEPDATADGIAAWVRSPLPAALAPRSGAIFVHGAVCGIDGISAVELSAGAARVPAMACAMPSPSLAAAKPGASGARRAIFWAVVPLGSTLGSTPLSLVATSPAGRVDLTLGELEMIEADAKPPISSPLRESTVAICMATHEPRPDLLATQIESLRAQTHDDWICLISDDASSPSAWSAIEAQTKGDTRFTVSRSHGRLGSYANFARALEMVPAEVGAVALCDQDDRWYPEKLEALLAELGDARLAFSDMRLTDADGRLLSDTYWTSRRPNHDNFASLLLGNSVTGAASLMKRDLLDDALPFPPRAGNLYHDHWLALVAAATGRIAYVDRPLYDYVQHDEAVIGHAGANRGVVGGGFLTRLRALRHRPPGDLYAEWRRIYFAEYCRAALTAVALRERFGGRLDRPRSAALERVLAADRSPIAQGRLALRQLRRLRRDDTGGAEAGLLRGLAWRRRLSLPGGGELDADLPADVASITPSAPARARSSA